MLRDGNLTKRWNDKRTDEIGELATWFNLFMDKLQQMIKDIADVNQASTEVLNGSSHINTNAQELSSLSLQLNEMASQFKG